MTTATTKHTGSTTLQFTLEPHEESSLSRDNAEFGGNERIEPPPGTTTTAAPTRNSYQHDSWLECIRQQTEYYFGPQNLPTDAFLQHLLTQHEGFAPLSIIAGFPKLQKLYQTMIVANTNEIIAKCATTKKTLSDLDSDGSTSNKSALEPIEVILYHALQTSEILSVSEDGYYIRPYFYGVILSAATKSSFYSSDMAQSATVATILPPSSYVGPTTATTGSSPTEFFTCEPLPNEYATCSSSSSLDNMVPVVATVPHYMSTYSQIQQQQHPNNTDEWNTAPAAYFIPNENETATPIPVQYYHHHHHEGPSPLLGQYASMCHHPLVPPQNHTQIHPQQQPTYYISPYGNSNSANCNTAAIMPMQHGMVAEVHPRYFVTMSTTTTGGAQPPIFAAAASAPVVHEVVVQQQQQRAGNQQQQQQQQLRPHGQPGRGSRKGGGRSNHPGSESLISAASRDHHTSVGRDNGFREQQHPQLPEHVYVQQKNAYHPETATVVVADPICVAAAKSMPILPGKTNDTKYTKKNRGGMNSTATRHHQEQDVANQNRNILQESRIHQDNISLLSSERNNESNVALTGAKKAPGARKSGAKKNYSLRQKKMNNNMLLSDEQFPTLNVGGGINPLGQANEKSSQDSIHEKGGTAKKPSKPYAELLLKQPASNKSACHGNKDANDVTGDEVTAKENTCPLGGEA